MAHPSLPALSSTGPKARESSQDPHQSLRTAVSDFKTTLNSEQKEQLRLLEESGKSDVDTVMVFTARLDGIKRGGRNGSSTATRLHTFLSAVGHFCTVVSEERQVNVVDTFVSSHPEVAALVWGSIKLTMTVFMNFQSFYDGTVKLLMRIAELCPKVSEYRSLYPESDRLQLCLSAFFASVVLCCKHLVEVLNRSAFAQLGLSFITSFDQEFIPHLDDIERRHNDVKDSLFIAKAKMDLREQKLQAAERAQAKRGRATVAKLFQNYGGKLQRMEDLQTQVASYKSARRRDQMLQALSTHDFMRPFKQSNEKRCPDTTDWVFKTPEFERWIDKESTVLWCSGKIGSGKTVVASSVIQHIQKSKGALGYPVSFYFAESGDAKSLEACDILRSLLLQRLRPMNITNDMDRAIQGILSAPTPSSIAKLLRDTMLEPLQSFILIDGLDECSVKNRRELLGALSVLLSSAGSIRLFLSSRVSLREELEKTFPTMEQLTLDCEATERDIATYITASLDGELASGDFTVGDSALISDIKTALTDGAQGMFLWAYFQLQDILAQHNDEGIRSALADLPRDLAETFRRLLLRIKAQKHSEGAQKVFLWVAASKRPLSLLELREAIAVEIGQQSTIRERMYNDMQRISSWCENLVQVDKESQVVQFAHSAVRTFLLKDSTDLHTAGFHCSLRTADHTIGEICVTYLNFNDFKTPLASRPKPLPVDPLRVGHMALRPGSLRAKTFPHTLLRRDSNPHDIRSEIDRIGSNKTVDATASYYSHPFLEYASVYWLQHTTSFKEETSETWTLWESMLLVHHSIAKVPWVNKFLEQPSWDWAYRHRHYPVMCLLVAHSGSSRLALRRWLDLSAKTNDMFLLDIVLQGPLLSIDLGDALLFAIEAGHAEAAERLVRAGAKIPGYQVQRVGQYRRVKPTDPRLKGWWLQRGTGLRDC